MARDLKKRKWVYIQNPKWYGITCDKCGGENIEWSEYEHLIWCYACQLDTPGTGGIFDGPIPINAAGLMGMSFDRIDLASGELIPFELAKAAAVSLTAIRLPDAANP